MLRQHLESAVPHPRARGGARSQQPVAGDIIKLALTRDPDWPHHLVGPTCKAFLISYLLTFAICGTRSSPIFILVPAREGQ